MSRKYTILWGSLLFVSLLLLNISAVFAKVPMIVFVSDRARGDNLHLLFDDGSIERLTDHDQRDIDPIFSPDGQTIIYSSNERVGLEAFEIFTLDLKDLDKIKKTNLTEGEFQGAGWNTPQWAPLKGDTRVVFDQHDGALGSSWDVLMVDLAKEEIEIHNISHANNEDPLQATGGAWSPDGTLLAFHSNRAVLEGGAVGKYNIYIADMTTRKPGVKQWAVTALDDASNRRPRWSPDGTLILFESDRDGDTELYTIDTEGKNLKQLTNNDKTDKDAEWSSGGIAFVSKRDGNNEIYRMDPDGGVQTNLTNNPKDDSDPKWSPNGRKILFSTRRDGDREVYVIDADGGNVQNLTNDPGKDVSGSWNPVFFLRPVEPQQKHFTTLGEVKRTSLLQNYPNPFNPETWIPYHLAEDASVVIKIYNVKGELVRSIEVGKQAAGTYQSREQAVYWDGRNQQGQPAASGVYFYQLSAGDFSQTRRMVVMK